MKNQKGNIKIIIFFILLLTILLVGFIFTFGAAIFDYFGDELTPIMEDLGVIEINGNQVNVSEAATYTVSKANIVIQNLYWLVAFGYVAALVFSVIFAMSVRANPHPALIGFYFATMILLIFGAIIMSNIYEDFYESNDEIGTRLQENTIMSHLLLYSPLIFTIISFIAGIFLFTKPSNDFSEGF